MDLRVYYKQVRDVEATIPGEFTVIVSLTTPDGGKPGVKSEVPKYMAARWVVENRARLATEQETKEFYQGPAEAPEARSSKPKGGKD